MKEYFSDEEIEEIIDDNKETVESRNEPFGVNREELDMIFNQINNSRNRFNNERERVIFQTSWILGGIAFYQPFTEGNKEIASSLAIYFLRNNDLDLPLNSREKEQEVFELLQKTIFKFEDDPTIISEVQEFLEARVVRF